MKSLRSAAAAVIALSSLLPAAAPTRWIDSSFVLFWRAPVRAHPGVPLDFQFSVYEADNRALSWSLLDAPPGMTISVEGEVDFPTAPTPVRSLPPRVSG
jgi:hypothetical protein